MRQVITITPDGLMAGLQHKKGQGLDLRQFGEAEITRASEIEWQAESQRWTVRIMGDGIYANQSLTHRMWMGFAKLNPHDLEALGGKMGLTPDDPVTFGEYEEAVQAEIMFLNKLRFDGVAL